MSMGQTKLTFEAGRFRLMDGRAQSFQDLKAAVPFRQYADSQAEKVLKRTLNQEYFVPRLPPLPFLDLHQTAGVRWILSRKRAYLAHAPGAGKTATTVVAFHLSGCEQALIVVPPGLTYQWAKEIGKFSKYVSFMDQTVYLVQAGGSIDEAEIAASDFIIVADSLLDRANVQEMLRKLLPKFVAVDEASRLKEITSTRSIAFYGGTAQRTGTGFKGLYRGARHVVFLDGSPMPNGRPMELWAPLYALDPEVIDCMDRHEFGVQFCNGYEDRFGHWQFKGSSRSSDFKRRLKERFMHVVTEEELSHPERLRSLLFMDRDVRSAKHKTWERSHLVGLEMSDFSEESSQGQIAKYRRELGIRKARWVADYVTRRFKEKGESLLVFCWHREVVNDICGRLWKDGINAAVVQGGTPPKTRERIFQLFQAGKLKVIVGNILAMGRGHNLQRADRVIFGEYSWSDELNKQAEKRASRKGSTRKFVRCEYVVSPESMDEKVLNSIFSKERKTKAVIG